MSSRTLFPPIVNSYEPAFVAGANSQLRVYFSLSSLSTISNASNLTVHASILRKDGVKVLNTENDLMNERYRATGIILNLTPHRDVAMGDNYYYVTINNEDLKSSVTLSGQTYTGWIPGWTYKIQLRLSTETYPGGTVKQEAWLQANSNNFSEWSTICYTKAISEMALQIPLFNYDSMDKVYPYDPATIHFITDLNFCGSLSSSIPEANEDYSSVTITLYRNGYELESSGELFKTELSDSYFSYQFKTKIKEDEQYEIRFTYITENGYVLPKQLSFLFVIVQGSQEILNASLVTIDTDTERQYFDEDYSVDVEEDAGRIGVKMISPSHAFYSGNLCVRRASGEDNFSSWEDIKIVTLREEDINDYPVIYDYTAKSGVWYKYGIQSMTSLGERGKLMEMRFPVQRIFNYSYLLGQEDKQLILQFDNLVSSFKYQILDSKTETIGSTYPYISRNAAVKYRTFPITGLISMWMDENKLFLKNGKKDIYTYDDIIKEYEDYNLEKGIMQYDYTYERDFRQAVLDFLQDGKPKLFKSPTEGNIIVRLTDVTCTPNKTLDRLVYNFSANASEIDEPTMANFLKYGFYNPGHYSTDFSVYSTYIGQLDGNFKPTDNIFKLIYEKYDSQDMSLGGYAKALQSIERVRITINDPPLRIKNNNGDYVVGNNLRLVSNGKNSIITIYDPRGIYEFDSLMLFYYFGENVIGNDGLYLLGDAEGKVTSINATIDFIYGLSTKPYVAHEVKARTPVNGIGQFFEEVAPGTSIYSAIYYKYYIETSSKFRYLSSISSIEIEANPHTVFAIKDAADQEIKYHEVNDTGILNLYNLENIIFLTYVGKRYPLEFHNESTTSSDIIKTDITVKDNYGSDIVIRAAADVSVTYRYTVMEGSYKEA